MKPCFSNPYGQQEQYANYSVYDFLGDDFFINTTKNPSYESVLFWESFLLNYPHRARYYYEAKDYINQVSQYKTNLLLTESEISSMWSAILQENKQLNKKSKLPKLFYFSIAAALTGLLVATVWWAGQTFNKKEELQAVANELFEIPKAASDQIQLVVSKSKTVQIDEKEAVIAYDDNSLTINNTEKASLSEVSGTDNFNQIIVPKGKRATLTLADGSKIWINSGSKVTYPTSFSSKNREIYVDGEVFADVAKNPKQPFVIKTSTLNIEVLGTTFNVQAYSQENEQRVVLVTGAVSIQTDKQKILLSPKQKYENNAGKESVENTKQVELYTSWIEGMYYFESETLENILKKISRYYGVEVHCDEKTSYLQFSGKLDLKDNVQTLLEGLEKIAPIRFVHIDNTLYISSK